ncbi:hypothetical protein ACFOD0_15125 [Shewanella intestini]|uniref:Uncharacterized protein n=1 Tax=Shewanella intestini TaxID=2017544 RepID=A0ABS5I5U5_9GAMM|nr:MULTISPECIES: hypothetical protein [Shewanella]MBR9729391.1 hypothetical protein [Shewanella intestini]MRG37471.1 hypothetical protein [Shewanella sp. XMDDZSB0408]
MNQKLMGLTCQSCVRLSEIEGEVICFEKGRITRLTPDNNHINKQKMVCASWQKK